MRVQSFWSYLIVEEGRHGRLDIFKKLTQICINTLWAHSVTFELVFRKRRRAQTALLMSKFSCFMKKSILYVTHTSLFKLGEYHVVDSATGATPLRLRANSVRHWQITLSWTLFTKIIMILCNRMLMNLTQTEF